VAKKQAIVVIWVATCDDPPGDAVHQLGNSLLHVASFASGWRLQSVHQP
jgi:hypothetical protein